MSSKATTSERNARDPWQSPDVIEAIASLPRLIAVWPSELSDTSSAARARLLAMVRRALRAERRRGIAGHWTYNLARHGELLAIYRILVAAECQRASGYPAAETFP